MFSTNFKKQHKRIIPCHLHANLFGPRVMLRVPQRNDYKQWALLRTKNEQILRQWEPCWPKNAVTFAYFKSCLRYYKEGQKKASHYVFFIIRNTDQRLIGGLSLGNVRRGVVQSGQIGYWCGEEYTGQGYMKEGLDLLIDFSFQSLNLHRLEAASIPTNNRSIRLLQRCGFDQEGLLRSYIKINGQWRDHLLFSRLKKDGHQPSGQI